MTMTNEYRTHLSQGGRVVIPAACRHALNLTEGQELVLRLEGDELRLYTVRQTLKRARVLLKKQAGGRSLAKELLAERRRDAQTE